jgi:hypothetical protein
MKAETTIVQAPILASSGDDIVRVCEERGPLLIDYQSDTQWLGVGGSGLGRDQAGVHYQGGIGIRKMDIGSKSFFRPSADPPLPFHIGKVFPTPSPGPSAPNLAVIPYLGTSTSVNLSAARAWILVNLFTFIKS